MKSILLFTTMFAASSALLAADSGGADAVKSGAQKLGAADNYSWTQTTESTQFTPKPSHGKTEKDGVTYLDFTGRDDNKIEAVVKAGKGAIKTEDGWKSLEDAAKDSGDGGFNMVQFMARRIQNLKTPALEAADMVGKATDLTKTDDVYAGALTEDGAKGLMSFGRRGGQAREIRNAKGTVKFWLKDGVLTKYQYRVQGTTKNRDGDDVDIDRTTTVDIKDVGTTKITVPEEAKGKLS
jgi:hypothetical protein